MTSKTPFYHLVPKGVQENADWRLMLLRLAKRSKAARRLLWVMCKRDPLFFINSFVWIYEPRPDTGDGLPERRPFNTYPHQDEAVRKALPALGKMDIVVPKSREQGASWLFLAITDWAFDFYEYGDYLLVSRNLDAVDKLEDRGSLFVKAHFMLKLLPSFLRPRYVRSECRMVNKDLGGTIVGAATTESVGVGGRVTWAVFDEFGRFAPAFGYEVLAVTQHTTNCRIFISSAFGDSGPFYDVVHKRPAKSIVKIYMHWMDHPVQNRGAYMLKDGILTLGIYRKPNGEIGVRPDPRYPNGYPYPAGYPFIEHSRFKVRSPYFDRHLEISPSDQYVARELEIDFGGSVSRLFDDAVLITYAQEICRPPDERLPLREFMEMRGAVLTDRADLAEQFWLKAAGATLLIWGQRSGDGPPIIEDPSVTAADISLGSGASNSTMVSYNARTREKILQLAHNRVPPNEWAEICVAVCKWLGMGWLIWENHGPGITFGQRVQVLRYPKLYINRNEESRSKKETDTPGWSPNDRNKPAALLGYRDGLENRRLKNFSKDAIEECRQFIVNTDGRISHQKDVDAEDPGGKNKFHGDLVLADAMAYHMMCGYVRVLTKAEPEKKIAVGSRAWRDEENKKLMETRGRSRLQRMRTRMV